MAVATHARMEALADLTGACELTLTRAVIQYRPSQELAGAGGRMNDIGLALVLDGEYAASAEALDLGSAELRQLDLGAELVVVDWVYETTLDYVRTLLLAPPAAPGQRPSRVLLQYCHGVALSVLRRAGLSAVTRPTLLRLGFRDLVRDLDPNEGTALRLATGPGEVALLRMDHDQNALVVERRRAGIDTEFERLLLAAFPDADTRRLRAVPAPLYQLRFPLPLSLAEVRALIGQLRAGFLHLYARYEPERLLAVRQALDVFGPRDTLARIESADRAPTPIPLRTLYGDRPHEPGVA